MWVLDLLELLAHLICWIYGKLLVDEERLALEEYRKSVANEAARTGYLDRRVANDAMDAWWRDRRSSDP